MSGAAGVSGAAESERLRTVRERKVGLFDHQRFKPKRLVIQGSEGCLSLLRMCLLVRGQVNLVFAIQQELNSPPWLMRKELKGICLEVFERTSVERLW